MLSRKAEGLKIILLSLLALIWLSVPVRAAFPNFAPDEGIYLIEENSGNVILSQNADEKYVPASTTKLMTALLLTEHVKDLDQTVTVGDEVNDYGWSDSTAGLWQGQTLSYKDLLHALLVPSGNDAAGTIAINVGRLLLKDPNAERHAAAQAFIDEMNKKAESLGLFNTHFVNPHGVYDPNHYSTPAEMAVIAREAFKNGDIKSAASAKRYVLKYDDGTDNVITSTDLLLFDNAADLGRQIVEGPNPNDPNAVAAAKADPNILNVNPYKTDLVTSAKTGNTDEGGRTFVYFSEMGDADVIGVIFKTGDLEIFSQSKQILEELNNNYAMTPLSDEDGTYTTVSLENTHFKDPNEMSVAAENQIQTYATLDQVKNYKQNIRWDPEIIESGEGETLTLLEPVKPGTKVGAVVITDDGNPIQTVPIYSKVEINPKNWQDTIIENMLWIGLGVFGILLVVIGICEYRRRHRRAKLIVNKYNQSKY